MDEARVKRIVELMHKNDAPMTCMLYLPNLIKRGHLDSLEIFQGVTQEALFVRDIYASIEIDELDDLTGKSIIRENKPLVAEFYNLVEPILADCLNSGFKAQNVPDRLEEICKIVNLSFIHYDRLPGSLIYTKALDIGYIASIKQGDMLKWLIAGKPVIYHPEKLPQLVEFAQTFVRAK